MKAWGILIAAALLALAAHAEETACNDTGKVYKVCADQEASYKLQLEKAKSEKKPLVVVVGAEWCPWCMSLHHMLGDPKFTAKLKEKFVLVDVALYKDKTKLPTGEAVLNQLKTQANYAKKIDGIPVLAVVNPENGKATLIDTEPLEKNTKKKKGHDPKKVLAALESGVKSTR